MVECISTRESLDDSNASAFSREWRGFRKKIGMTSATSNEENFTSGANVKQIACGCCNEDGQQLAKMLQFNMGVEQCVFHMDESYVMDADRDVDFVDLDAS